MIKKNNEIRKIKSDFRKSLLNKEEKLNKIVKIEDERLHLDRNRI